MADLQVGEMRANERAARRGITFALEFPEWWELWRKNFAVRGTKRGQFVMCRSGDVGGYEAPNVRIDTVEGNIRERMLVQHRQAVRRDWGDNVAALDWLDDRQSVVNDYEEEEDESFGAGA